jgi:hypothetical protein
MKLIDSIKRFILKEKFENLLNKVSGSSISLLLDYYSNRELEICIQHLKDLYNFINNINKEYSLSIISVSSIGVDDILNLDISLLNQLIKEEVNTRMYLYNFLKNYISEEITLSDFNPDRVIKCNDEYFLDDFIEIIDLINRSRKIEVDLKNITSNLKSKLYDHEFLSISLYSNELTELREIYTLEYLDSDSIKKNKLVEDKLLDYDTMSRIYGSYVFPSSRDWKEYYLTVKLYIPSNIYEINYESIGNEEYIVSKKQINGKRFVDTRLTIQDRIDIDEFIKKHVKEI